MSRKKRIEAFALIAQGFALLSEAEKEMPEMPMTYTVPNPNEPSERKCVSESPAVNSEKEAAKDDLEEMNLLELKTLAKDMKIDYPKNVRKEDLIEIIRNANKNDGETNIKSDSSSKTSGKNVSDDEISTETSRKNVSSENKTSGKKNLKKQSSVKNDEVVLPEDATMKQLIEETQEMEDDEIRDLLTDAGISEKGGRNALLAKLYQAVNDGLISLEDDEDEIISADSNETTDEDTDEETVDTSKFITDKDTDARSTAITEFVTKTYDDFKSGNLSAQKLRDHLKDNFGITLPKKATPADILDKYIECAIKFISDDGETVKEGAYYIQGIPYCCGEPLEITVDENGNDVAICHICENVYDFADE